MATCRRRLPARPPRPPWASTPQRRTSVAGALTHPGLKEVGRHCNDSVTRPRERANLPKWDLRHAYHLEVLRQSPRSRSWATRYQLGRHRTAVRLDVPLRLEAWPVRVAKTARSHPSHARASWIKRPAAPRRLATRDTVVAEGRPAGCAAAAEQAVDAVRGGERGRSQRPVWRRPRTAGHAGPSTSSSSSRSGEARCRLPGRSRRLAPAPDLDGQPRPRNTYQRPPATRHALCLARRRSSTGAVAGRASGIGRAAVSGPPPNYLQLRHGSAASVAVFRA